VRCFLPALLSAWLLAVPAWAGPADSWSEHRAAQLSFEHEGERIAYQDRGSGPVILMVHGVPSSSWLYRKLTDLLVHQGYRVVVPDLVGFGASSKPEDPAALSMGAQAERLLALMAQLEIERFTLVCHDMGGLVSWELLERAPERVERLVVLNTIAFAEGWNPPADLARQKVLRRIFELMARKEKRAMALTRVLVTEGLEDRGICRDERVVEGYYRPLAGGADRAVLAFMSDLERIRADLPRYQRTLGSLEIPAMIAWGEQDEILLADGQVPRLAELLSVPPERVHRLEGCAHYVQEECAPQLAEHIGAFMAVPPSPAPMGHPLPPEGERGEGE
jgi:pimeloyl-ACP methyl ester carboxylesterase